MALRVTPPAWPRPCSGRRSHTYTVMVARSCPGTRLWSCPATTAASALGPNTSTGTRPATAYTWAVGWVRAPVSAVRPTVTTAARTLHSATAAGMAAPAR